MQGIVKNCRPGRSPQREARPDFVGEDAGGAEGDDPRRRQETAAAQTRATGLVEGEGAQVPDRARGDLQRQRGVPAEPSANHGSLPPPEDGRGLPRRVDRNRRLRLPAAGDGPARPRLQRHGKGGHAQGRQRRADARIFEPAWFNPAQDAPRDRNGSGQRDAGRGYRRDPRAARPEAATAEEAG
jgi:hypothetical protein